MQLELTQTPKVIMGAEDTEEPEEDEPQTMDALEWILMFEGTLSEAAASHGIEADMSDEDLEGKAWEAERTAYDEGFNIDEESLLSVLTAARQAAGGSSTVPPASDDHPRRSPPSRPTPDP